MAVPYTFGSATTSIPLSQLDSNFATTITLGNTAVQLGNTVTTLNNMTLANATVSSGNATVTTLTAPTHNSASSLTFQTNGTTTAITVDTSQNVGIGTSSPASRLQVSVSSGTLYQYITNTGTGDAGIRMQSSTTADYAIFADSVNALRFYDFKAAAERMRIDTSGNVMVGTTTAGGIFTAVQSSASAATLRVNATSASYTNDLVQAACATAAGTGFLLYSGYASSTTLVYAVRGNGNVINTNNSYGAISDIKLKENITDATPKLADLMQVKVRNYNLKSDPTHKQLGVIAQELETVFPSMIEEAPDRDEEGNDLGTTTKSVKYSVFVPMLIKSIQEQQATINALTARIVALEAK